MRKFENLCMKCMSDKGQLTQCPFCGYINDNTQISKFAEKKLILQNKYVVGNIVSKNAESICYIGFDIKNNSKVFIREFFPEEICVKDTDGLTVLVKESCSEKFENLKSDFLQYFRALAKVRDIDAIIPVYDIFLDYGTAYVISDVVDGITLLEFIQRNKKPLDWDTAKILFMPVISALGRLARTEVLHLAINPKSLIVGRNGKMYIANFSTSNLRQVGVFSDFEFSKGFTAPEQYVKNYKLTQATDVYGLTATLFFALVGFPPKDASERDSDDRLLIPVKILKNIPPHVVSAISNGLKVNIQKRTLNFEVLRDELTETSAKYLKEQADDIPRTEFNLPGKKKKNNFWWITGAVLVFFLLFASVFFLYLSGNNSQKNKLQQEETLLNKNSADEQEKIIVPELVGKNFDDIQKNDESSDYNIFLSEKVFDDKVEEGKIISQSPQSGTHVFKGSNIVVTVSRGPKFKVLPKVKGLSLSQASHVLTKEGFIPVKELQNSNEIAQGNVIGYKDCSEGDKLEFGSQVTLIVSKGKLAQ